MTPQKLSPVGFYVTLFRGHIQNNSLGSLAKGKFVLRSLTSANNCFGKVSATDGMVLPKEIRGRHPDFSTIVVECWMLGATSVVHLKNFFITKWRDGSFIPITPSGYKVKAFRG